MAGTPPYPVAVRGCHISFQRGCAPARGV